MTESDKRGILFGGNLIVDRVKIVNDFPKRGTLANILQQTRGTGGAPLNNSVNVKILDPELPVAVMGCVGDDEDGSLILDNLRQLKINTSQVKVADTPTSYTDVYTEENGGARTFLHYRGANAGWGYGDIDFNALSEYRIVHIGYILLLDAMDAEEEKHGTQMARVLNEFRNMGVKTAVDVVTDLAGDFKAKVTAALKYTDYLILNEIEAAETVGKRLRNDNDALIEKNIPDVAKMLMDIGEGTEIVVIHMPEGAYGLTASGEALWVDSFKVPEEEIKGAAGAGDAFASGILYALHENKPLEEAIRLAHGMAAKCLYSPTCTEGAVSFAEIIEFINKI